MFQIIIYSIVFLYTLSGNDHQYPQAWHELQSNEGWELIKEIDRIKVFSKEIFGSALPAHRAEIISSLDLELLIRTAWQVEKSQEIFLNAFIVDAGIYILDPNVLKYISRPYYDMTSLFQDIADKGLQTLAFPIREYWLDIGGINEYKKGEKDYNKSDMFRIEDDI